MSASSSTPGISSYRTRAGELRWRVRWREGGRHCSRSFVTEEEAEAFRAEVVLARTQGRPLSLPRSMVTLAQFAHDQWWPGHAMLELEPSTRQRHREVWNKWVLPHLGDEPLTAIDVEDLLEWQVKVKQAGIGHATLQRARAILSSVFSFAALRPRKTGVKLNPVAAMPALKRQRERPVQVYPPLVFETLRAVLRAQGDEGERDALMVSIAYLSGCRPGEVLRRRVGDVRERTLQVVSARGQDTDGDPSEKGTKTGRVRQVPLLAPLRDELLTWIEEQGLGDDDLLLTDANGRPWTEATYKAWRRRVFRPATERVAELLGIPDFAGERPYTARHSFASLMIRAGWGGNNLKGLAEIMGHDLSVLLSCYAGELAEFAGADPIDAEVEIYAARDAAARLVR